LENSSKAGVPIERNIFAGGSGVKLEMQWERAAEVFD
jgi:hypothetical protein